MSTLAYANLALAVSVLSLAINVWLFIRAVR